MTMKCIATCEPLPIVRPPCWAFSRLARSGRAESTFPSTAKTTTSPERRYSSSGSAGFVDAASHKDTRRSDRLRSDQDSSKGVGVAFRGGLRSSLIATGWTGCPLPYGRSGIKTASLSSTPVREHTFRKPASPSALMFGGRLSSGLSMRKRSNSVADPRNWAARCEACPAHSLTYGLRRRLAHFQGGEILVRAAQKAKSKISLHWQSTAKPRRPDNCGRLAYRAPRAERTPYFGARLASFRCKVRRCMLSRRAVSETLRPHNS